MKRAKPTAAPPGWTEDDLAAVGVYRDNGVWTHSLGDEHAARIISGAIPREEALRAMKRRKRDLAEMIAATRRGE